MTNGRLSKLSDDMTERIADLLLALADVGERRYDVKVDLGLPQDHPLATLTQGINSMAEALAAADREANRLRQELEDKLSLIERQRASMRELATPIIEVWEGVLCLPVVGVLDTVRSNGMTDSLLETVVAKSAECTIVDITGIDVMDTRTADHFMRMARAVRLLGTRFLLSGVSPQISQTMVHMGVDMLGIEFFRSLRDALKMHLTHMARTRREGFRR